VLTGGDGGDVFLVGSQSGFDRFDGGIGANSILAAANNALIGIASIANIQEVSGNGFANARIVTASGPGTYDFSAVSLIDIAGIQVGDGGQTIIAAAGDDVITGGANDDNITGGGGSNTLNGGEGDDTFIVTGGGVNL
jgi:Ca2+-binding RTX toxin-like protein